MTNVYGQTSKQRNVFGYKVLHMCENVSRVCRNVGRRTTARVCACTVYLSVMVYV